MGLCINRQHKINMIEKENDLNFKIFDPRGCSIQKNSVLLANGLLTKPSMSLLGEKRVTPATNMCG